MRRITIKSDSHSPAQMEEILVKAVNSLSEQRENRPIPDEFIKNLVETSDKIFAKVIDNMVKELEVVLR